jgi:hypothetical protein
VWVGAIPELRRLVRSKVGDRGDRAEVLLGDASCDEAVDLELALASLVAMRLRPWDRRKAKGDSEEDRELRAVERDPRFLSFSLSFSFCSLLNSFFARCSPTSSRSGSPQTTSNMVGDKQLADDVFESVTRGSSDDVERAD